MSITMMAAAAHNPWTISELDIAIRLSIALLLGGLIGWEREQSNHAAGLRTNILVCLGACLLMLLSIYGFSDFVEEENVRVDPARLAAAVITGVGFLGAGTILFTGKAITGLTTAASLWVVAAIGLAVGAGFYFASGLVTTLALVTLWAFNKFEKRYMKARKERILKIQATDISAALQEIHEMAGQGKLVVKKMLIEDVEAGEAKREASAARLVLHMTLPAKKGDSMLLIIDELKKLEGVSWISSE